MRALFITSLITLVIDQITKIYVVFGLGLQTVLSIDVLPPYINFRMAWNQGINFGLFAHDASTARYVLVGISIVICVALLVWVYREPPRKIGFVAAGLLIGGAVGNVIDRLAYGAVADFLNMSCCGIRNPFSFNVADIAIFAGAIGLAIIPPAQKQG